MTSILLSVVPHDLQTPTKFFLLTSWVISGSLHFLQHTYFKINLPIKYVALVSQSDVTMFALVKELRVLIEMTYLSRCLAKSANKC